MANWYYINKSGKKTGPITAVALKELARQGLITPETMIENQEGRSSIAGKVNGLIFPAPVAQPPGKTVPPPLPSSIVTPPETTTFVPPTAHPVPPLPIPSSVPPETVSWFYYAADGQKVGPIPFNVVQILAAQGVLIPETILEAESGQMAIAKSVKGLMFTDAQRSIPAASSDRPSVPPITTNPSDAFNSAINDVAPSFASPPCREPAPGEQLVEVLGVAGILRVYDDKIVIQKEAMGDKTLYYSRLSSVQFSAPSIGVPGFLQFTFAGSGDLQGVGIEGVASAMRHENSFVFLMFQRYLLESIRIFIDAKIGAADITSERATLLSVFASYTEECEQLQYSIGAVQITDYENISSRHLSLQIYGDRLVYEQETYFYVFLALGFFKLVSFSFFPAVEPAIPKMTPVLEAPSMPKVISKFNFFDWLFSLLDKIIFIQPNISNFKEDLLESSKEIESNGEISFIYPINTKDKDKEKEKEKDKDKDNDNEKIFQFAFSQNQHASEIANYLEKRIGIKECLSRSGKWERMKLLDEQRKQQLENLKRKEREERERKEEERKLKILTSLGCLAAILAFAILFAIMSSISS